MKPPIIILGIGEIGGVIARGVLRLGHPVYPLSRDNEPEAVQAVCPDPAAVVIAVGEKDLDTILTQVPDAWRNKLILLQNELLPRDWESHGLDDVTVLSVWFEKKPGQDFKVIIPSPVFGPHASLVQEALATLGIPVRIVSSPEDLLFELVCKNLYILTTNIAGLEVGGDVESLWLNHRRLAEDVAKEILVIQAWLTGNDSLDQQALIAGMVQAFEGDPRHKCMGRSAPSRRARALEQADQAGISVPVLAGIRNQHN